MSHELEDNVQRRKMIVDSIPIEGLYEDEVTRQIMNFGYNLRGAMAKRRELVYLKMLIIKGNKYYPVKTVIRARARARSQSGTLTHAQGVQHDDERMSQHEEDKIESTE